jgi:hypothetical protein
MAKTELIAESTIDGTASSKEVLISDVVSGTRARFAMYIDSLDLVDPKKSAKISIYISDDNKKWNFYLGFTWQGQAVAPHGQAAVVRPAVVVDIGELKNKYIKAEIETSIAVKTDLTVENL